MDRWTRPLALIIAGVGFAGFAAGLARLALARLLRYDLGASIVLVSSLTTWLMAARAASSLASGVLADTSPRARLWLMWTPLLGLALLVYLMSILDSVAYILALNAAWGILGGMTWPVTQSVTALLAGRRRSGTAMSLYFSVAFLGMTAGQFVYGPLPLDNRGCLRLASASFAVAAVFIALAAIEAARVDALPPARPRRGVRGLHRRITPTAAWILFAAFTIGYASGMMKEFLYIYLGEAYRLTREALAGLLGAAGLMSFLAGLAVGPLADRLGAAPVLAAVLAAGATGETVLGLAPTAAYALLGMVLVNLATRSSLPLTRNARFLGTEYATTLVGFSNTLNNVGQMVGPIAAGLLYEHTKGTPLHGAPFLTAAALLAATLLAYPAIRSRRSKR